MGERRKACVAVNSSPPAATATSHQERRIEPTASAMPVSRCRIDRAEVIWKRYQVGNMKGDRGRCAGMLTLLDGRWGLEIVRVESHETVPSRHAASAAHRDCAALEVRDRPGSTRRDP